MANAPARQDPRRRKARRRFKTFKLPKRLREALQALFLQRAALNRFPKPASEKDCGDWFRASTPVFGKIAEIEERLRGIAKAPRSSYVEYVGKTRFRCIRASAKQRKGSGERKRPRTEEEKVRFGREYEPEVGHLCFELRTNRNACPHFPLATLQDVLALTRAKKKRSAT